ncbi:MAG TPA: DUF1501 domain-containing protein, partial [Planctomycetes bacterium]|nr:DUF1501 domain-containing protein [Planctomycetota bacterium]
MSLRKLIRGADAGTRRTFLSGMAQSMLGVGAAATFGPGLVANTLGQDPKTQAGQKPIVLGPATAKHVIYLFMAGGMSHIDMFDPKPGAKTQGPNVPIATSADGIMLGQYLPKLAKHMHKACVINSMSSTQGAHAQAQYLMRTSYELRGTIQHPSTGAWCHRMAGRHNKTLPGHVIVGGGADTPGAGFFPAEYTPVPIGDPDDGLKNASRPSGVSEGRFNKRLKMLKNLDTEFGEKHKQISVNSYSQAYLDAVKLMRSADLTAFKNREGAKIVVYAYGEREAARVATVLC